MHERAYGTYDVRQLDDQYDTAKQLPDGDVAPYFARFDAASERARAEFQHERDLRYGPHERETFDYFPAARRGGPLFVWIHGGYWRRLSKDACSFVAPPLLIAGAAVAILNYPLAPGPSLDTIVASVSRGFEAACKHAHAAGVDPERAFVGGHSVGAQLAATVAANHAVRGLFTLSGLYDLAPLRYTRINEWIAMDEATAARNSPISLPPCSDTLLVASVGGREQAEFHRQQRMYVDAWRAWNRTVREIPSPDDDHFSIVLELARQNTPLGTALIDFLALDGR